jgi:hypothetical protein
MSRSGSGWPRCRGYDAKRDSSIASAATPSLTMRRAASTISARPP